MLAGMAKPMPIEPPLREKIAVLMPRRSPFISTSAPPELPGLMAASVWMKKPRSEMPIWVRATAETMPLVTVWPTPNGLPMASTRSPTSMPLGIREGQRRKLLALGIDAQHRQVGPLVIGDDRGVELAPVAEHDGDLLGAVDHMLVGDDQAIGADDDAGAERVLHPLPRPAETGIVAEELLEERIVEHRRGRLCLHHPAGVDVDHRRRGLLDDGREGQAGSARQSSGTGVSSPRDEPAAAAAADTTSTANASFKPRLLPAAIMVCSVGSCLSDSRLILAPRATWRRDLKQERAARWTAPF